MSPFPLELSIRSLAYKCHRYLLHPCSKRLSRWLSISDWLMHRQLQEKKFLRLLHPETAYLLRRFLVYVNETDGIDSDMMTHVDSLIHWALEEHPNFQGWLENLEKMRIGRNEH